MSIRIRVGDEVEVVRGTRSRAVNKPPTRGRVMSVDHDKGTLVVEGHNLRKKHIKKSAKHPQGGRLEREQKIAISNVMLIADDGSKLRLAKAKREDGKVVAKRATAGED
ncbi:MAG: 50S ribosomal protein L24 [bacterium]|nr:50S ribosomal protein L24 [bacterium]